MPSTITKKDILKSATLLVGLSFVLWAYQQPHDNLFYKKFDIANATLFFIVSILLLIEWWGNDLRRCVGFSFCALAFWNFKDFILSTETKDYIDEYIFASFVGVVFLGNILHIIWNYYKRKA